MRILSPIDRAAEVGPLVDAGADELYGGYVSGAWLKKYSLLGSANQRYFPSAQFSGLSELRATIKDAHRRGAKFFLVLNAPFYTAAQHDDLLVDAARYAGYGVDAFIVADIGLIMRLRDRLPGVPVHLSTLSTIFNSAAAGFFERLGVGRMVLPRELTLAEMAGIAKANPSVEFDAFIMVGKCPNIEGFCSFTHNSPDLIWPCEESYDVGILSGGDAAAKVVQAQSGWSRVNRRQACGLCAVAGLKDAGVTALKLVGRGGPTAMKVRLTQAVRRMVDYAGAGHAKDAMEHEAKTIYKEVFGKDCNPYICYFPELWQRP